ncbi:unnamed protein product [Phytophthora lilii]|uniref:Unnamed protein product n=1 Tax=Phytophthora lilii TaxID=2077276 RepID=A0A9W6XCH1_9STRA|nr:unnamed protein product [Phytophthora lilii]
MEAAIEEPPPADTALQEAEADTFKAFRRDLSCKSVGCLCCPRTRVRWSYPPSAVTGRVLNDAELRYHIAEKEVVAVTRVLEVFRTIGEHSPIVVAEGQKDEDGLAAILSAGITPRERLDEVVKNLIPAKGRNKAPPVISVEMLEADYEGQVLGFDGAAKTSTRQGSCGSEYEVLKDKFASLKLVHVKRDFNQAADYLTSKTLILGESWNAKELLHLELMSKIHGKLMKSVVILDDSAQDEAFSVDLPKSLNETPGVESEPLPMAAKVMAAVTRSRARPSQESNRPMDPLQYQEERWTRIKRH